MKKILCALICAILVTVACGTSSIAPTLDPNLIQTVIVNTALAAQDQTQAAYTLTPQPTQTPQPTATTNLCTNKGWADIETYLKQFDEFRKNIVVGTSISAYLDGLENIKNKINNVEIDACSEHARQTIVSGCANIIYAETLVFTSKNNPDIAKQVVDILVKSLLSWKEAKAELEKLGIKLNLP